MAAPRQARSSRSRAAGFLRSHTTRAQRRGAASRQARRLRLEPLETRRLLAADANDDFLTVIVNPDQPVDIAVLLNDNDSNSVPLGIHAANLSVDAGSNWTVDAANAPPNNLSTTTTNLGDVEIDLAGSDISQSSGVVLATVRRNVPFGSSLADFRTVEAYPSGNQMWLSITQVGTAASEGNIDLATAWFPFANGWVGGHLDPSGNLLSGNGLSQSDVTWLGSGLYEVRIPGVVNSLQDGVLLAIGGSNEDNVASAYALGGNAWQIRLYDNQGNFGAGEDDDVSFVYVPFSNPGLVAARVNGSSSAAPNTVHASAGTPGVDFTIARESAGTWRLNVAGQSPATGMLLLGTGNSFTGPDDNFLSYDADGNDFLIHNHDLPGAAAQDSDWNFVFVPFTVPGTAPLMIDSINTTGTVGTASINPDNRTLHYDPSGQFGSLTVGNTASDTFTYTVRDMLTNATDTATVTVTLLNANDPPTLGTPLPALLVDEDAPDQVVDLSAAFGDADLPTGDSLSYSVQVDAPWLLDATLAGNQLTLDFLPDQFGSTRVQVTATDLGGLSVTSDFQVIIRGQADGPMALADGASVSKDAVLSVPVLLNDVHVDGTRFSYTGGNLDVVQNDTGNSTTSVTVTLDGSTADFQIAPGSNRGDYNVQIGATSADDVASGILLSSVRQNGVDHGQGEGFQIGTSSVEVTGGAYFIPLHQAPSGAEMNSDVAAAWFPLAAGWLAGHARTTANGGPITSLNGPNNVRLGQHFGDNGNGVFMLSLPGIHSQTDGVLLTNGGKNEDNYSLQRANPDGSWTIFSHDNGTNGAAYEQDAVAYAFIPNGLPGVVSGKFDGNASVVMQSGTFSLTEESTGVFRLAIPGQSPASGVLILSPEGGQSGNVDNIVTYEPDGNDWLIQTRDLNPSPPALQDLGTDLVASFAFLPFDYSDPEAQLTLVSAESSGGTPNVSDLGATLSVQADGTVQYDPSSSTALQALAGGQSLSDTFRYTLMDGRGAMSTATVTVTVYGQAENAVDDSGIVAADGTLALGVLANDFDLGAVTSPTSVLAANIGFDPVTGYSVLQGNGLTVNNFSNGNVEIGQNGNPIPEGDGVVLATVRQLGDGNPDNHRLIVVRSVNSDTRTWLDIDNFQANAPRDSDLGVAFFPFAEGWIAGHLDGDNGSLSAESHPDLSVTSLGAGKYRVEVASVSDSLKEGLLFAIGEADNGSEDDNLASVRPLGGNAWEIMQRDNTDAGPADGEANPMAVVYLPFDSPNQVAGRVNGTWIPDVAGQPSPLYQAAGNFTVERVAAGTYELTIPGVTPGDGMLLLSPAATDTPYPDNVFLSYQASGGKFVVETRRQPSSGLTDTDFAFAFVPFSLPPQAAPQFTVTAVDAVTSQGAAAAIDPSGVVVYDPSGSAAVQALRAGQSLTDTFSYTIDDGGGNTASATVSVTVLGIDDPLVLQPQADIVASEDDPDLVIDLKSIFADPDELLVYSVENSYPGLLTTSVTGDTLTLDFQDNRFGVAFLRVAAMDEEGRMFEDRFRVTVESVEEDPIAADDTLAGTDEDTPFSIPAASLLANDSDADRWFPVEGANLRVVQNDTGNTTASVTVTVAQGTPDFGMRPGSNRGDYNIQIGSSGADDPAAGIVISAIRQNGVDHGQGQGVQFGTSATATDAGGYFLPLHQAPGGAEYNSDVAAVYFPFDQGWLTGHATNSANGGPITSLNASPGITLATTTTLQFQQGQDFGFGAYAGTVDGWIHEDGTFDYAAGSAFLDGPGGGSPNIHGLFRFDNLIGNGPGQIPFGARIVSASLALTTTVTGNGQSGGPYTVHQLLTPFDTSSNWDDPFGGNGPDETGGEIGPAVGSFTGMAQGVATAADVTAIVQNWADGQANFGFDVMPGTSDGWSIEFSENGSAASRPRLEVTFTTGNFTDNGNGVFQLALPGVNSQTDGVLLVTGGKNEDNYALQQANNPDGSWTIYNHDNGADAAAYEQDPVAFVFVPVGTPNVVSGKFAGNGSILLGSGFTATPEGTGTLRLSIPGQSPTTGVLLVSPEGGLSLNVDNIVSYEADGNDWIIQTRDLTGLGLQNLGTEPVASFAFFPFPDTTLDVTSTSNTTVTIPDRSDLGATLTIGAGGDIQYDPTSSAILQALTAGQQLTDQFRYTISDGTGRTDTAVVTLNVNGQGAMEVDLNLNFPSPPGPASPGNDGQADTVEVGLNAAGDLEILVNGQLLHTVPAALAASQSVQVIGSTDDDTLIVNFANGDPIPAGGIQYAGGGQTTGDLLVVEQGTFGVVVHNATGPDAGNLDLNQDTIPDITYAGLEPVDMTGSTATDFIFNLPPTDNDAELLDLGGGNTRLQSTNGTFELTDFANPSGSITINGGAGNDNLRVTSLDSTFAGSLTLDGQDDNDVARIDGAVTLGGDLLVTADQIALASDVTTGGDQWYDGPVTLESPGNASTLIGVNILFTSTLRDAADGVQSLTVSASDTTVFNGAMGDGGQRLNQLTVDAGGLTLLGAGSVTTAGDQTFDDPVILGDDTLLSGNSLTFGGTVDGFFNLVVNMLGTTTLNGDLGSGVPLDSLDILTGGPLAIDVLVDVVNQVFFEVTDQAAAGDDLVVSAAGTIQSAVGDILLLAGDDLTLASGSSLSTPGTLTVLVDAGNADPGVGGVATIEGTVTTGFGTVVAGDLDDDVFQVSMQSTSGFLVDGFLPSFGAGVPPASGDTLTVSVPPGATDPLLVVDGVAAGAGQFSTSSGEQPIEFVDIEQWSATAAYHLLLDRTAVGGDGDLLDARVQSGNLELRVNGTQVLGAAQSDILSLTLLGSDNADETFSITETVDGLPRFTTTPPAFAPGSSGGHLNPTAALRLGQSLGAAPVVGDVTLHIAGGGGDTDELLVMLMSDHDVLYASDTVGPAHSGNVGVVSPSGAAPAQSLDLLLSFAGLEPLTFVGAGGSLLLDATSTPATDTLTVSDASAAADGVTLVAGNGGFEDTRFSGFDQLQLVAGPGSETITLAGADANPVGGVSLALIVIDADSATDDDDSEELFQVQSLPAGVVAQLLAGAGDDRIQLFDAGLTVDNIGDLVVIDGESGEDQLLVIDSGDVTGDTVEITESTLGGLTGAGGPLDVVYGGIELLDVTTTSGGDDVRIDMSAGGGDLVDAVISGAAGDDTLSLVGVVTDLLTITLNGNAGSDTFNPPTSPADPLPNMDPRGKLEPSLTTEIFVHGESGPAGSGNPTLPANGDTDTLNLDLTSLTAPVILDTIAGIATSTGPHRSLVFSGMEDLCLDDASGDDVNLGIGELYVRTTQFRERITYTLWNDGGVRLRIDDLENRTSTTFPEHFGLAGGTQALTRIVTFAGDGDDLISVAGHVVDGNGAPIPVEFHGGDGDDYLTGANGNDILVGGPGRDRVLGGEGDNVLFGDSHVLDAAGIAIELPTDGDDYVVGRGGVDVIFGGGGDDRLYAGAGDDYVHAGSGDDLVDGGNGNDILVGGADDDTVSGGSGDDLLLGALGNDRIYGRAGHDVLLGGGGLDEVRGDVGDDLVVGGTASAVDATTNDAALRAILNEWINDRTSVPAGLGTLQLDAAQDLLIGDRDADLFHQELEDRIYDFRSTDGDLLLP